MATEQVHEIGTSGILPHEMESKNVQEMQTKQVHEVHEMDSTNVPETEPTEVSDK